MAKPPHHRSIIAAFVVGFGCLITGSHLGAQPRTDEALEAPLHQRDPFDRITLNKANRGAVIDVYPLTSLDRRQAVGSVTRMKFRIRRLQDPPERLYDVAGSQIEKIELFHELLREEVRRLIDAKQLDEAFPYLDRLVGEFPETLELQPLIEQFYIADAGQLFRNKQYDEALLALDQVFTINPDRSGLARYLQSVLGEVIQIKFDKGDFSSVRRSVSYARQRYGSVAAAIVEHWNNKLKDTSNGQLALAKDLLAAGKSTQALAACRRAMLAWPELEGAAQLNRQILGQYPRVMVGVTQRYVDQETLESRPPKSLNWATRRSESLVRRSLIEFVDFTADGGQYTCPVGTLHVSPDRRQITMRIKGKRGVTAVGYGVARSLLNVADHDDHQFDEHWAEFLDSVYLPAPNTVEINLTRPTLRPEALLPTPRLPPGDPLAPLFAGPYQLRATNDLQINTYQLRVPSQSPSGRPQEIVEQYFADPTAAADALLRGEIDVLDRVEPADVPRLSAHPEVRVVPYRVPTIHFLVFNGRQPLLRRATFRRGLLYAINRDGFVHDEILAGDARITAHTLTGPLPRGVSDDDSLGYAYDRRIQPRGFDPSLGFVLLRLAQAQLQQQTQKSAAEDPATDRQSETEKADLLDMATRVEAERETPFPPLVLAVPDSPIAKAASSAIASDLRRVGFEMTLRALEPGFSRPQDEAWDLLYVEATIEDPFVDIPDLINKENLLGDQSGVLWQAVRALQEADDWDQVRDQFALVHKLAYDHTPLIPLWQIVEHLAYREQLDGLGSRPASLYQNVDGWRLNP